MPETPQEILKRMTASDVEPQLSDDEIDSLIVANGVEDGAGFLPGDGLWTPTYDLNAAAAGGWLIKAGRASGLVEIDPPGSGIMTSKIFDNCRAMAKSFRSKCSSVQLKPSRS
jgi:hypothetical protein